MELIPRRNQFLLQDTDRNSSHIQYSIDEKSTQASKTFALRAMGGSIPYSVPTLFLVPMATSKEGASAISDLSTIAESKFLNL
jgi:hypothetical protein